MYRAFVGVTVRLTANFVTFSSLAQSILPCHQSCCDVLVFSNNPGIDFHERYRGKKMNEGFHSVCGLVSAGTVLYNNFPNKG